MSNNMQNIKEKKENEKLKIHTLREETKNGPKKVKVPVQKARVEGAMLNKNDCKPATWRDYQRHGTDIKQIHIKPEEQELQATTRTSSCETRRVGDAAELKILQFPR